MSRCRARRRPAVEYASLTDTGGPPSISDRRETGAARAGLLLVLLLVVAGSAAVGAWWWHHRQTSDHFALEDPATVDLPPVAERDAARDYLLDHGGPLRALVDLDPLVRGEGGADPAACQALGPALDTIGDPATLQFVAAGIPDPETAEMATGYVDLLLAHLVACANGDAGRSADLAFAATVLDRRLDEVGDL